MANDSEERRFQIGDIVRFKPGFRTPLSFDIATDEVGLVVGIEPHPPQTGPTYRISVQFPHGLVEGVFQHEYELTALTEQKPISEQGLKDLILETMAKHPVCPPEFDISIRSFGDGSWEVASIPPKQGPAYTDCVDYIAQIANAIRLNYYLQVLGSVKIVHKVTAPTSPDDQIAIEIARRRANDQRTFTSGTQSGVTEVPLPLTTSQNLTVDAQVIRAPVSANTATAPNTIELRLSDRPSDIRDAAQSLAKAITDQIAKLQASKPNLKDDLAKHNEYVEFLEKLANGLKELADALDRVAVAKEKGLSEPIFLGTAGKIAEQLSTDIKKWIELHHADAVGFIMTASVFATGYDLLAAFGVQGGIAAIVSGLLTRSFSKTKSQNKHE